MSTYDEEVRSALKPQLDAGDLNDAGDSTAFFDLLSKVFPACGSKIDWRHVPGSIVLAEPDSAHQQQRFVQFFDDVQMKFGLTGVITYAGDSATDFTLTGEVEAIRQALPVLLEVPQHHYLVGPDCSWCICLTMEGDMGFVRTSPSLPAEQQRQQHPQRRL